jgi:hypothetical protein
LKNLEISKYKRESKGRSKAYYQESCILIIEYSSVVTVAELLDGSFESQSGLEKPNSGSIPESPKICLTRFNTIELAQNT